MPNWCVNQVEIFGEPAVVAELVKFVREENSEDTDAQVFSFRNIVPTPDDPRYMRAHVWGSEAETDPINWYNWNIENWGTKWSANNAYLSESYNEGVDDVAEYEFETAWSPAEPVIAALSAKFPTLTISHRYCEAGIGYAGQVVYREGQEITREDYEYGEPLPSYAWADEDQYERDYNRVPMTAMERFCDEHFGGIVGG